MEPVPIINVALSIFLMKNGLSLLSDSSQNLLGVV